jgi:translocation and assembly module TamB
LTKRTRVVLWSFAGVIGLAAGIIVGALALLRTDWGRERVRRLIVAQVTTALAGHGRLFMGSFSGGLDGHFVVDSLVLYDDRGAVVASASHVEADAALAGLFRNDVHVTRLLLVRPYLLLEEKGSVWNISRLFPPRAPRTTAVRSALGVSLDSAQVRDGRFVLVLPDSLPRLPGVRREFNKLQLVLGPTRLVRPGTSGGAAAVRRLATEMTVPPVSLSEVAGTVRWWPDSLALDFPQFRLPASHASVRGRIAWAGRGPVLLDLRAHADTLSLADVAWVSTLVPKQGDASTDLHVHNATAKSSDIAYSLSNLDLRATRSRLTGGFTVTPAKIVTVTDLALGFQPLDLDLVREMFGEGVPKKNWQGALTGTVRGPGGPVSALRIDEAQLMFDDRRVVGARSHFTVAGVIDAHSTPSALHGFDVQIADLDVRSIGAVVRSADSLHGVLTGRLTLDGAVDDIGFSGLSLWHVDGDRARSHVSGEGRLATDETTRWLDATLVLDTIAVATLARDRTTVPLRGIVHGTLELHATRDTMAIDALLQMGDGSATFLGKMLLDSSRTWVSGHSAFRALDPRVLIARKEIPVLRLDGTADVLIDRDAHRGEGHVELSLDTTSVIGVSRVVLGQVRAGVDSTGFHVDTAEIQARDWRVSARGRLARTSATRDTLHFAVAFDSLTALRALLLDSAGTSLADSLHGAVGAEGTLVGSLDTLALAADFSVRDARWNSVSVHLATGRAEVAGLPSAATGALTLTADGVSAGGYTATRVQGRVDVRDGSTGRVTLEAVSGDSLRARLVALVQHSADSTRVDIDSLGFALGEGRWSLVGPSRVELSHNRLVLDSMLLRSARGATIAVRATLPDSGAVDGALHVRSLGPGELAFTGLFSPDLAARAQADLQLSGTRDAPHLTFTAGFDSVKVGDRTAPSLAVTGTYDNRRALVEVRGAIAQRELLAVSADLPVDLALRSVAKRLSGDTLIVRVHADSVPLVGFEALFPQVEGLGGTFWAEDTIRGTWERKNWAGFVRVREGSFDLPRLGALGRHVSTLLALRGDSVIIVEPLSMVDSDSPGDFINVTGALVHLPEGWRADLRSQSRNFRLIDNPRVATLDVTWNVHLSGALRQPYLEGEATLPSATFILGQVRKVRPVRPAAGAEDAPLPIGMPIITSMHVTLGNDVRLKSTDANVQLSGELDLAGEVSGPYARGEVRANRGTYRVNLGLIKRTFRVDSGIVRVAGTPTMPATIDIWTSYVVRSADADDRTIVAHLTGASDAPRLDLSSTDAGTAIAQSEIISYLIFGAPTFGLGNQQSTVQTATAVLVPSLGGVLEGFFGTLMPFFSSLQVTTVAGTGPQNLTTNPLDGLLNSFGLSAGRQLGTDSFLTLSGGVCRGSRVSSTQSAAAWFGIATEYQPKRGIGGVVSLDPGSSPCNRVGRFADIYQFGFDLFKNWRF